MTNLSVAELIIDGQLSALIRDLREMGLEDKAERVWDIRRNLYREWGRDE